MYQLERKLKALGNRRRLAILRYLKHHKEKEAWVGDIADEIKLSFKATSKHLAVLMAADILEREQRKMQVFYKIVQSPKDPVGFIISLL